MFTIKKKLIFSMENNQNANFNLLTENSKKIFNHNKEQILYYIFLADKCGKYEDVLKAFENLITRNSINFHKHDRYIFEKSIKLIINNKRTILKKLINLSKEAQKQIHNSSLNSSRDILTCLEEEKNFTKNEIQLICDKVLNLIDIYLKNCKSLYDIENNEVNFIMKEKENETFCYQLKGDLHKYLFQVVEDFNEEQKNLKKAEEYFIESYKIASMQLDLFSHTSLSAIYSYAEFLQKYKQRRNDALDILMQIYDRDETRNILNGIENADTQIINLLNDIKVLISKILNSEDEEGYN